MAIKINNRSLSIPSQERIVGYTGDNLVETRVFELTRIYAGVDLSEFDFKIDTEINGTKNIIDLDKSVNDDKITLTWTIRESHILTPGRMSIQIRAFSQGEEKWHSAVDYVIVQSSIKATDAIPDPLPSEFVQMEVRLTALANSAETDAETATTQAAIATTKAQGASDSAAAALASEQAAKTSEDAAKRYAETAEGFADEAERQADIARNNILNGVAAHNESEESHPYVLSEMVRIESIARGKASAKVFDTVEEMNDWLSDPDNVEMLKIGDNLYIRDINVPDYWWDGEQPQILEAQAINLSDYYTKAEVDARLPIVIEQSDYDEVVDLGQVIAGRIYYVVPDGALGDSDD